MGQLTNQFVSQSYQGLLNLENANTGVTATLQYVTDGVGNRLPMLASTSSIVITGSFRGDGSGLTGITTTLPSGVVSGSAQIVDLGFATTSSLNTLSGSIAVTDLSQNNRLTSIESITGSLATTSSLNSYTLTSSFNAYTSSNDGKVNDLISKTGSYVTETESGSFVTNVSQNPFVNDQIVVTKGNGSTSSITINNVASASFAQNASTASFISGTIASASFATNAATASIAFDVVVYGKCNNPAGLTRGTVVRIVGANGDNPLFDSASWTDDFNSANTLGMLSENVAFNAFANVVVQGKLIGINTSGMTAGDMLYLSSSGQYTTSSVPAPYHEVRLGQVLRPQLNNGSVYINIDNGYELTELHDVDITSPVNGDLLVYRSGSYGQWVNETGGELGFATTGSNNFVGQQNINGNVNITGSLNVTQGITGSLQGTASNAVSSSQSENSVSSSFSQNAVSSSFSNLTISSSFATNASNSLNLGGLPAGNYARRNSTNTFTADQTIQSGSELFVSLIGTFPSERLEFISDGNPGSGGGRFRFYDNQGASNLTTVDITGSLGVSNGITGSLLGNASSATNATLFNSRGITQFALTGSNTFVGNQTITGSVNVSGSMSVVGNVDLTTILPNNFKQNLMMLSPLNAVTSSTIYQNYLNAITTSLDNDDFNLGFVPGGLLGGTGINTITGSIFISGSNNFIMNLGSQSPASQGRRGIIGSANFVQSATPSINTSSLTIPQINNNYLGSTLSLTLATGSNLGHNAHSFNSNILLGAGMTFNHPSASIGAGQSTAVQGNINLGGLTSNASGSVLTAATSINNNLNLHPALTLNHISSSINTTNNFFIGGGSFSINNRYFTTGSNNIAAVSANILSGQNVVVNLAGSPSTNVSRTLVGNLIGGQAVNISLEQTGTDLGGLRNSLVYGHNLNVTGSHSAGLLTQQGAAFLGRWNGEDNGLADSARTVFAVGTGTAAGTRRTGFYITSGSLVGVSGSMDIKGLTNALVVTGSQTIQHSIAGQSALTVIAQSVGQPALSVTGSLNVSGSGDHNIVGNSTTITGSVRLSSVMNLQPLDPLPAGNIGDLAVSSSNQLYFYNGAWTLVV